MRYNMTACKQRVIPNDESMKLPSIMDINVKKHVAIDPKITIKDIRNSLWRCRDFEFSLLWKRSIFLITILLLCFTGYGVVIMKICDKVEKIIDS